MDQDRRTMTEGSGTTEAKGRDDRSLSSSPEEPSTAERALSEGIVLLVATAFSYVGCYLYELGYTRYFGIPTEFVVVSVQNLLVFAVAVLSGAFMLGQIFQMIVNLSDIKIDWVHPALIQLVKRFGPIISLLVILAVASGFEFRWLLWPILYLLLPLIIILVGAIASKKFHPHYLESLDHVMKVTEPRPAIYKSKMILKTHSLYLIMVFCLVICLLRGRTEARTRTTFPFLGNTPEVVLRRYGDHLVIGRVEPESGNLLHEFRLVPFDQAEREIVTRQVGQLKPGKLELQNPSMLWANTNAPSTSDENTASEDSELSAGKLSTHVGSAH